MNPEMAYWTDGFAEGQRGIADLNS
jgi:hypothetical protein